MVAVIAGLVPHMSHLLHFPNVTQYFQPGGRIIYQVFQPGGPVIYG